jgi:DNA-binding transcriptional MerR regulator
VNVAADPSSTVVRAGAGRDAPPARGDEEFFRSGEVTQVLGVSRRQLQYWARTGLVRPSGRTPGGHHRWCFRDLVALKTAKRLIDSGVSVQRIRRSIEALQRALPNVRHPLAELVLVATGDVVIVLHEGTAFEAATGQEWVFEIAAFRRELERWQAARGRATECPAPRAATG